MNTTGTPGAVPRRSPGPNATVLVASPTLKYWKLTLVLVRPFDPIDRRHSTCGDISNSRGNLCVCGVSSGEGLYIARLLGLSYAVRYNCPSPVEEANIWNVFFLRAKNSFLFIWAPFDLARGGGPRPAADRHLRK